jgi:DNA-binding SARP family transcriptional activator
MAASVRSEFGVLGPLQLHRDGTEIALPGLRRRTVLLRLLLSSNRWVSSAVLIEDTWNADPPAGAKQTLRSHISFLRKVLGNQRIEFRQGHYLVVVGEGELDATEFELLIRQGRTELDAGHPDRAEARLQAGLSRWRGPAYADAAGTGWGATEARRLDELRLVAFESLQESLLCQGRHGEVIPALETVLAEHPLRERLWGQLMLALYRSGRQADALRTYQKLRHLLVEELGIEPSRQLAQLEEAMVRQEPALADLSAIAIDDRPGGRTAITATSGSTSPDDPGDRTPLPSRLATGSSDPFMGRARELSLLEARWREAGEGSSRLVLLGGEPGIGKTALATAFARTAWAEGATVLYGRCDEEAGAPYQPWVDALDHLVRSRHPRAQLQPPARMVELVRLLPSVAERWGVATPTGPPDESERYLLFGAVGELLSRVATGAPVVVVLDDLHWADPATLHLLQHLVTANHEDRLMVIGTYRDVELDRSASFATALASFHREAGVTRINLSGLDHLALLGVVEGYLTTGPDGPKVALRDVLLGETRGNPFFFREVLRHLEDTGVLARIGAGEATVDGEILRDGLPVSIREVVGHRVGRLGNRTTSLLSAASVIGREFDVTLVARVCGEDDDAVLDGLDAAVESGLLEEGEGPGRLTFCHALVGQAVYEALSPLRRARLHRLVAEAIKESAGVGDAAPVEELAFHWLRATRLREPGKAVEYARLSGDRAVEHLAPDEGVRWYRQALQLVEQHEPVDQRLRSDLRLRLGEALRQAGNPEYRALLLEVARTADAADDHHTLIRAALANTRGFVSSIGEVDDERIEILERALACCPGAGAERALLLALLCQELAFASPLERRRQLAEEARTVAESTGDDAVSVRVANHVLNSLQIPPLIATSRAWAVESLARSERVSDPLLRFWAASDCAAFAACAGDIEAMDGALTITGATSERVGQTTALWAHAFLTATRTLMAGALDRGDAEAARALEIGTAGGEPDAEFVFGAQMLLSTWARGTMGQVVPVIEEAVARYPGIPAYRAALALALVEGDRPDEAHRLLVEFADGGYALPEDDVWLTGMVGYSEVAVHCGDERCARDLLPLLEPWVSQLSYSDATSEGPVSHYVGALHSLLGDHDRAVELLTAAVDVTTRYRLGFFRARAELALAVALQRRGGRQDRATSTDHLRVALDLSVQGGYANVERRAARALEVAR